MNKRKSPLLLFFTLLLSFVLVCMLAACNKKGTTENNQVSTTGSSSIDDRNESANNNPAENKETPIPQSSLQEAIVQNSSAEDTNQEQIADSQNAGDAGNSTEEIGKKPEETQRENTVVETGISSINSNISEPKQKTSMIVSIIKTAAVAIIILLLMITLIFMFIRVRKSKQNNKKNYNEPSQFDSWKKEIDDKFKSLETRIKYTSGSSDAHYAEQKDIEDINNRISKIEDELHNITPIIRRFENEQARVRQEQKDIQTGKLDPLTVFNRWAAAPSGSKLPEPFYYINGEPRIRTNQQFSESQTPTRWIKNRHGATNYLLPNPAFFDQMTDISNLYKMDLGALKSKGQNRIEVISACEISDMGFIEYPGELRFI